MTSFEDFNTLGLDKKFDLVSSDAELIDNFNLDYTKISLYAYNNYIIEVQTSLEFNTIKSIKAMSVLEAAEEHVSLKGRFT